MSEHYSLGVGTFTTKLVAALEALGELQDMLGDMEHPQEFGMDGCPACKAREAITAASESTQDAQDTMRIWMPDA